MLRTHTSPVQIRLMESQGPPDLRRHAGQVLPARHARRPPHPDLPSDRGPGGRPRHQLRRPGRHHRDLHHGVLRARHPQPPAAVVLPLHRAVGGVRDHVHDLQGQRVPDLFAHGMDRARWVRHGRPGRVRGGGPRRRASGPGSPSASGSTGAPRCATRSPTCGSSSTTTCACCARSDRSRARPSFVAGRLRPLRGRPGGAGGGPRRPGARRRGGPTCGRGPR